jgi:hypothetical protein
MLEAMCNRGAMASVLLPHRGRKEKGMVLDTMITDQRVPENVLPRRPGPASATRRYA